MLLAIDIGSRNIKFIEGEFWRDKIDKIVINKYDVLETPEGTVSDGIITDKTGLYVFLRDLIEEKEIKSKNVVFTLRSTSVLSREIILPQAPPKRLKLMVENEMYNILNINKEYYIDYTVIKPEGSNFRIMAYAVPVELALQYYELARDLKLNPYALDVHANSIIKLFEGGAINDIPIEDKAIITVDMGNKLMNINMIINSENVFSRCLELNAFEFETDLYNMGFAKSEKNNFSGVDMDPLYMNNMSMTALANKVIEEINKMRQFELLRSSSTPISHVFLYGGVSKIKNIDQYLENALQIHVEKISRITKLGQHYGFDLVDMIPTAGSLIRVPNIKMMETLPQQLA